MSGIVHRADLALNRDELLRKLNALRLNDGDTQTNHLNADRALLRYINDEEITKAFNAVERWYA